MPMLDPRDPRLHWNDPKNIEKRDQALKQPPANPPETNAEGEKLWNQLCNEQGWAHLTQVVQLEGFIRDKGLFTEFATRMQKVAEEENS